MNPTSPCKQLLSLLHGLTLHAAARASHDVHARQGCEAKTDSLRPPKPSNKLWHATRQNLSISPRHRASGRVHAYRRCAEIMKQAANMIKVIALSTISLVAAVILWPFSVAGVIAYLVSGMRFNRWVSSGFALLAAVGWRLATGVWPLRIGDGSTGYWFVEAMSAIVNWALAAIFVSAFALWPTKLVEGYRSMVDRTA